MFVCAHHCCPHFFPVQFFFEEHVDFAPMLAVGWAGTTGPNTSLATSYAMFSALRQRGLRAHSWV